MTGLKPVRIPPQLCNGRSCCHIFVENLGQTVISSQRRRKWPSGICDGIIVRHKSASEPSDASFVENYDGRFVRTYDGRFVRTYDDSNPSENPGATYPLEISTDL
ncbi:uncharacterized protein G2W53_026751 [Senna tora]|uniref:Uncharacterized protein n=1 Tax=Senna tora TaxID=362788 RepID=A0A834THK5_9FABA|nr:uncharacterized protein G2W53_026751 [Senna tora]